MTKLRPNGPAIRLRRQQRGLKVGELAKQIRVSPQHVYNLELGHNGASIEVLYRIAIALDAGIEDVAVPAEAGAA